MTVQMVSGVAARTPEPELYDFARPMKLARERVLALTKGSESFARSWHTELSAKLTVPCQISVMDVAMLTYDDYIRRLPASTAMVVCSIDGAGSRGVMQLPLQETLIWTSLMLGGAGRADTPERPYSAVEHAVIARIVTNALELMRYTFGDGFPERVAVESVQYTPQAAKAAGPSDAMIVTTFEVAVDDRVTTITFAMPDDAASRASAPAGGAEPDSAELMSAQLDRVPVRIALQFQPTRVRPEVVLNLAEGDLIRMTHSKNRPLDFAVEGQVLAKAAVGASGSQLACVIVDTADAP